MKKLFAIALAVLFLAYPLKSFANSNYASARKTTHHIMEHPPLGGGASCSATAIGPHALLTASHCEQPVSKMDIDDEPDVRILSLIRDEHDHTIYTVATKFKDWSSIVVRTPEVGEEIFLFGNPGEFEDLLRKGYVASVLQTEKSLFGDDIPERELFDFNGYFGDSGAAIFDAQDNVIGVVSTVLIQNKDGVSFKIAGGIAIGFTKEELQKARDGK